MRLVRGTVNAVLMVTLIKPVAHLMVSRWRKQVQESPAAAMGLPVQEMFETALLEELGATSAGLEAPAAKALDLEEGRSVIRTLIVVGALVALSTAAAVVITRLIRRRQRADEGEWVAVPVEADEEVIEDVAEESLIG
ncbi:MAG: hypothetical protein AB1Z67_05035 [Candidatus Limnocylindrales bacterium]